MAIRRMPIGSFVEQLEAALNRKDGYIMGATGQNPKKWSVNSWWFTQYSGSQKTKALYWRAHAARVWDCNGLAEGIYKDFSGVDINTKARYNYSGWCGEKGKGMIPAAKRCAGAAVFWGSSASAIHHVAYLYRPVDASKPTGDWYIIEARGVMYGVVKTKLSARKPNFWGFMDKYFDYGNADYVPAEPALGERILKNGMEGSDVKAMQENLIALGYDCGKWGADGEFGDATELALRAFQADHGCGVDGEYGPESHAAMLKALAEIKAPEQARSVKIVGGQCWVRSAPNRDGEELGVAKEGAVLPYGGQIAENGWLLVEYDNQNGWVSGKYGKLEG